MTKKKIDLMIHGKYFSIMGTEDEEHMKKVADCINFKEDELRQLAVFHKLTEEQKKVLLEINLADDYLQTKEKAELLEAKAEKTDKELYQVKHELIGVRLELEKAQKELTLLKKRV